MRTHVGLRVSDLDAAVAFYRALLGSEPARVVARYAQFLLDEPGLNLALTEGPGEPEAGQHFGLEVATPADLARHLARCRETGLVLQVEEDVVCCHARQDKFWATDPDGRRWEVFFVHERYHEPVRSAAPCCPGCC